MNGEQMTMRLKDKVAVITGSASGLGFTYCKAFLKEGAKVVVNDISKELVGQAVRDLSPSGPVMSAVANVCDQSEVENMIAAVVQTFGRLDILVNNAGGSLHTPYRFEEIKGEDWDKVVDVNLKGAFLCCQSAVKQFRKQGGGKIVNVSALAGRWLGSLAGCHYTSAKAGLIGLTRHLAYELGPEGIYVNAIAPTITMANQRTIDLWNARPEEYRQKILSEIPLRRLSTPEEVAAAVIFLCTEEASYLTGVTLDINGGRFFS
jgi:NAD(P)-dependent dehydrogenase (short-subunit alcohol dehydrogenase family)